MSSIISELFDEISEEGRWYTLSDLMDLRDELKVNLIHSMRSLPDNIIPDYIEYPWNDKKILGEIHCTKDDKYFTELDKIDMINLIIGSLFQICETRSIQVENIRIQIPF